MSHHDSSKMDDIISRLEALEDEKSILQTLYSYGHFIDYRLEKEWVALFTEDAEYISGRSGRRTVGRKALVEFISSPARVRSNYCKHLLV